MIHAMLEIEIRDAVEKAENLNEDYSINWSFVDADAYKTINNSLDSLSDDLNQFGVSKSPPFTLV